MNGKEDVFALCCDIGDDKGVLTAWPTRLPMFVIRHRFPKARASRRERYSVYWMNLAILGVAGGMAAMFGFKAYLLIQSTALMVANRRKSASHLPNLSLS